MKRIEKKVLPKYFNALASGKKKYELRLADWECTEGDVLIFENGMKTKKNIRVDSWRKV